MTDFFYSARLAQWGQIDAVSKGTVSKLAGHRNTTRQLNRLSMLPQKISKKIFVKINRNVIVIDF